MQEADALPIESGSIFDTIDWDALIAFPVHDALFDSAPTIPDPSTSNMGMDLREAHHLTAKCVEIEAYIASFHSGVDQSSLINLITGTNLESCVNAFFDHFQSIQAIIHQPTFNITTTAPQLLTAMMLVGACYAHDIIPPDIIIQGSIHVLLLLQHSSVRLLQSTFTTYILTLAARALHVETAAGVHPGE